MKYEYPQHNTVIFGFDSAWTDIRKGAICAITFDGDGQPEFCTPRLVSFEGAREFIESVREKFKFSLVAIDQPTIVPRDTGMRPVERVAASAVSYAGGGVQPANRGKTKMFGNNAPIWRFLHDLDAKEQYPLEARMASEGHYLVEVFPALALLSLKDKFAERLGAPKYNPGNRKKFRQEDWKAVACVVETTAEKLRVNGIADWARQMQACPKPDKNDQDMLDAAICALVGLAWRAGPTSCSAMLGDVDNGYMVTPVSNATRPRLEEKADLLGVKIRSELDE